MRRSASEVIRNLEQRIARLERSSTSKTSSTMSWNQATSLIKKTLSSTSRLSDEERENSYINALVELSEFLRQHKNQLLNIRDIEDQKTCWNTIDLIQKELSALVGERR